MAMEGIWAWDKDAKVWRKLLCDADGKLIISDADPFTVVQDTPEDLKHLPHGYYAVGGTYLPLAVDVEGRLRIVSAIIGGLGDLDDVTLAALVDGHFLSYSAGLGYWQNRLLSDSDIPADIARDAEVTADIATHASDLDAHTKHYLELLRVGEYIPYTIVGGYGISQTAMVANTIYAVPFLVARPITVDRIAISVQGPDAGKSAVLGIYNNGDNLYPGTLIASSGGEISVAAVNVQAVVIDISLTRGLYWLAVVSNGTPSIRLVSRAVVPILGLNATFTQYNSGWTVGHVYDSSLPSPFTAAGSFQTQDAKFLVALRIASLD